MSAPEAADPAWRRNLRLLVELPQVRAVIGLLSPPDQRGRVFGLTATASALGSALGPAVGAALAAPLGLRYSFVFTAIALTLAGVWIALAVRAPRPEGATT